MLVLLDKLLLLLVCSFCYIQYQFNFYNILFILISCITSCANSYFEFPYLRWFILFLHFLFSFFFPDVLFFLPLLFYDIPKEEDITFFAFFIPLLLSFQDHSFNLAMIIGISGISYLMKNKTKQILLLQENNRRIKDDSEELKMLQEAKLKEQLERQDYEIQLAISEERNRIAREIHDSVGHNLSSSLLQIGAMIAINKDEKLKQPLINMKNTLSAGMNSIRTSVHDLHADRLDLEKEFQNIISQFTFCPITLHYHCTNLMDMKLKYCFLNILKEALNNIIKHSNATFVQVSLVENAQFYQFIVHDNGTNIHIQEGMGLKNMQGRVYQHQGIIRISDEHGLKLFITIPKRGEEENGNYHY